MNDPKFWAELITQTAFPIVLIVASIYWIGKSGIPRIVNMIEKIVDDFRSEMDAERKFHKDNLKQMFDVQNREHKAIEAVVEKQGDRIVDTIKEQAKK